jgi:rod shape determining protein RodA
MNKFQRLDWILLISIFLLLAIGLMALYSISFEGNVLDAGNLLKQSISILLGLLLMFALAFFDYRLLSYWSTRLYFLMVFSLLMVFFIGTTVRGTTGWIGFADYHIQPVEIAKVVMVVFLASFLSKKKTQLSIMMRIVASVVLVLVPVYLILKQPDFGSAAIIAGSWIVLLSVSGLSRKNLFVLFLVVATVSAGSWLFLKDYQKERMINFVYPENDPRGSGYNVIQSIVAVGSGGISGKGLGHGSQSQLNFLPEKHTDFIFSVIAEELGFLGAGSVFLLFGIIFWRLKVAAVYARDNFGYLVAVGIISVLFFQVLVNIGMNIGVMPVAGVPLPFLSYGGSAMVSMLAAVGVVLNIYARKNNPLTKE